ncbi:MAG TPA: hypothetical protein VK698_26900 [Kofleriaceae bacterium]|jgi:hypothetical protein|nr:hypothetical protein [Kofleriaceae bacterium]
MSAWWNLPFAVLVILALACRLGASDSLVGGLGRLLGFFGVGGGRQAVVDFLGIAGMSGLLFVGWADQLAVAPDAWLAIDALLSALGLGLSGAWVLARLGASPAQGGDDPRISRQMTMMEVDELPDRAPASGGPPASDPG